jgi:hypothetical protein
MSGRSHTTHAQVKACVLVPLPKYVREKIGMDCVQRGKTETGSTMVRTERWLATAARATMRSMAASGDSEKGSKWSRLSCRQITIELSTESSQSRAHGEERLGTLAHT